jgi:hypothetical protein
MVPRVVSSALVQMHHGEAIHKVDYAAVVRGPLSYATGLIDGYKREETIKLPKEKPEARLFPCDTPSGFTGPAYELRVPGDDPIVFLPYYEAGGRSPGTWRATWISAVWQ